MKKITLSICLFILGVANNFGQNAPILVEAESGTLGADFAIQTGSPSPTYIYENSTGGGESPGTAARVTSYSVTFPEAGTYDLYGKIYVGPDNGGGNDDSFFVGNGFGTKLSSSDLEWLKINNLNRVGFINSDDVVQNGGTTGTLQWKWVKLSGFEEALPYTVSSASTLTFQIGAREDGLWIDKFAFGKSGVNYTLSNLDSGTLVTKKIDNLASFMVYLNPSTNEFIVQCKEVAAHYKIFNLVGAKVEEGELSFGENNIGGSLKLGPYILDVTSDNKRNTIKIIKN